ncbi:RNA polymerase sigma factor [Duncaniella muris]|uniref:RNA polymerase sigma factor n=1 Tax=Duncaniella muris TaxID=2094150 RepID=UPI0015596DE8|nr:sigma-70 family RNA polymerase sigma factor [Duncaniella muris]
MTETGDILTSIFTRLRPRLHSTAARWLGSDSDADDVLQDAFLRLWGKTLDHDMTERAAATAVKSTCIDTLRRRKVRRADPLESVADIEPANSANDTAEEIYEDVTVLINGRLSEQARSVLLLRDRDEWEFDAIAEHLGLSEANVRMILSRARRTVRDLYNQQCRQR